jgi:outer membrane protein, multidrug efflux system
MQRKSQNTSGMNGSGAISHQSTSMMSYFFRASSLAILWMLMGCASRPIPNTEHLADLNLPDQWDSTVEFQASSGSWIEDLGDPELVELIDQATGKSHLLKAGMSRIAQLDATVRLQGSAKYPSFGIDFSHGVQESFSEILGVVKTDVNSLALSSRWEIDLWGRIRDEQSATYAQLEAVGYNYEDLVLTLSSNIAKIWFSALEAKFQYELAVETRDNFRKNLKTLEARYLKGLVDGFDLRLFRAQTAANEAIVSQRASQLDALSRQLQTLLTLYPDGAIRLPDQLAELRTGVPASIPSDLLSRRPDLRAAERQLAASVGYQDSANKNWLPSFGITGSWGVASNQFGNLLDVDDLLLTLLGNITAPLFQGGRLSAERDLAKAKVEEQVQLYSYAVLEAAREVETALNKERLLSDIEKNLAEAVHEIKRAETQAWDLYNSGLRDITAVLDTQRRSVNAQSEYLSLRNLRIQNRIDLYVALGGDFTKQF